MAEPRRVLVHEPDADLLLLILHGLAQAGYAPVGSRDWEGEAVDAVLVEPGCPDAHQVLEQVRGRTPAPVICLSNYEEAQHGAADADAYLVKPFRLADVVAVLGWLVYDGAR